MSAFAQPSFDALHGRATGSVGVETAGRRYNLLKRMSNHEQSEINKTSVEILFTDASVGLTFVSIAETTRDNETRERNIRHARKAYDWILSRVGTYNVTVLQRESLESQLDTLRRRLELLGQTF